MYTGYYFAGTEFVVLLAFLSGLTTMQYNYLDHYVFDLKEQVCHKSQWEQGALFSFMWLHRAIYSGAEPNMVLANSDSHMITTMELICTNFKR